MRRRRSVNKTQENAQTQDRSRTQENAQGQNHGKANESAAKTGASSGKSAQLSETQRTRIKDVIVKDRNVARVNNVNFNITVGAAVPRSVHFEVLPVDVVTIVPEYRGFDYIIVGDQTPDHRPEYARDRRHLAGLTVS